MGEAVGISVLFVGLSVGVALGIEEFVGDGVMDGLKEIDGGKVMVGPKVGSPC